MPYPPRGGIGGGAGFTLGPAQNVFTGADRAAAESARDTYATANPTWVTNYNADASLNIRLEFTDNSNLVAQYQVRNEAGNDWVDNQSFVALRGQPGADGQDGMGVIDQTIPVGTVLRAADDNGTIVAAASSLVEGSDSVGSDKMIQTAAGKGVAFGGVQVQAAGEAISFQTADLDVFKPVAAKYDPATGTERPVSLQTSAQSMPAIQTDDTQTISGNTVQFIFASTVSGTATGYQLTSNGGSAIAGCNIILRYRSHTDNRPLYNYMEDFNSAGFTVPANSSFTISLGLFGGVDFLEGVPIYASIIAPTGQTLSFTGGPLDQSAEYSIPAQQVPTLTATGNVGAVQGVAYASEGFTGQNVGVEADGTVTITSNRPESLPDITTSFRLIAGNNISLSVDTGDRSITINSSGGGTPPTPVATDLRYGLSSESDPAQVVFSGLTDVASPTDPITVPTGQTSAGQYFHIFTSNTHEIVSITDTVLSQVVYQRGSTGNIFSLVSDSRTESGVTYDALTIGPLNAGVNEEYVVRFT